MKEEDERSDCLEVQLKVKKRHHYAEISRSCLPPGPTAPAKFKYSGQHAFVPSKVADLGGVSIIVVFRDNMSKTVNASATCLKKFV